MQHLHLLQKIDYVPPGPKVRELLELNRYRRYFAVGNIKHTKGVCKWCEVGVVKKGNAHYCSENCRESCDIYCYPQRASNKMWTLITRQNCTCLACGEIFEDEVDAAILDAWNFILKRREEKYDWDPSWQNYWLNMKHVTFHALTDRLDTRFDLDHKVPLFQGGEGIGIENVWVICSRCHQTKTASENSNRLKTLFREEK